MADFLAVMAAASRARAAALDEDALRRVVRGVPPPPAPRPAPFAVFAEVKRRSPSAGELRGTVDPVEQARAYARGGACAVSVLTEPSRFGGSLADLAAVAEALRPLGVPAMRKDFLVDRRQVYEARAAGAGGVLLIAAILDDDRLGELAALARDLSMFVLLEAFDEAEVDRLDRLVATWPRARGPGADGGVYIGLNCRDLRTLHVDPDRFSTVRRPWRAPAIAESGIAGPTDAARVAAMGWSGVLVGTALMQAADPERAVAELVEAAAGAERVQVKLCGLRTPDDVHHAARAGADLFGFVVADSPRRVSLRDLPALTALAGRARSVVVMRDFDPDLYAAVAPHAHAIQCRAESLPRSLPPLPAGTPPPRILRVVRDGPNLVDRVAAIEGPVVIDATEEGSGRPADPARVRRALALRPDSWLAGGLNPDNVADRILDSGARTVDVSSGIESAPGVKDPLLMRNFVVQVRLALHRRGIAPPPPTRTREAP